MAIRIRLPPHLLPCPVLYVRHTWLRVRQNDEMGSAIRSIRSDTRARLATSHCSSRSQRAGGEKKGKGEREKIRPSRVTSTLSRTRRGRLARYFSLELLRVKSRARVNPARNPREPNIRGSVFLGLFPRAREERGEGRASTRGERSEGPIDRKCRDLRATLLPFAELAISSSSSPARGKNRPRGRITRVSWNISRRAARFIDFYFRFRRRPMCRNTESPRAAETGYRSTSAFGSSSDRLDPCLSVCIAVRTPIPQEGRKEKR